MNFDSGEKSSQVADETRWEIELFSVEPVRQAMELDCVESRVGQHDLYSGTRCRIATLYRLDFVSNCHEMLLDRSSPPSVGP
jgi:hypothetical protein